jgi:MOSC domain-containing protein YiiM
LRDSPRDEGVLAMIVRRPHVGVREVLEAGVLDVVSGLVGDSWRARGSSRTPDGSAHSDMQVTIMNARAVDLVAAQDRSRWPLAGDQLFVDFSLSEDNVPPGTRLTVGAAIVEVTHEPHTGCGKFTRRFGIEATKFVNSPEGRALHLRGINARVIQSGPIRVGDMVRKSS